MTAGNRFGGLAGLCLVAGMTGLAHAASEQTGEGEIVFRHVLDNAPIEMEFRSDQELTPAVKKFHKTVQNPYSGDEEAVAEGKKTYQRLCQACHLKTGKGRIGPDLTDDEWRYERTATDKGRFEIIYAGGAGAMQAFGRRIDQDEILKVMAYIETFQQSGE